MNCSLAYGVCSEERETSDTPFSILDLRLIQNRQSEIQNEMVHRLPLSESKRGAGPLGILVHPNFYGSHNVLRHPFICLMDNGWEANLLSHGSFYNLALREEGNF